MLQKVVANTITQSLQYLKPQKMYIFKVDPMSKNCTSIKKTGNYFFLTNFDIQ